MSYRGSTDIDISVVVSYYFTHRLFIRHLIYAAMPSSCCVPLCTQRGGKDSNVSFHEFPYNRPEVFSVWLQKIRRDFVPKKRVSLVCSNHFTADDYYTDDVRNRIGTHSRAGRRSRKKKVLKPTAVPSIFPNYPQHLQPPTKKRRILSERRCSKTDGRCSSQESDQIASTSTDENVSFCAKSTQTSLCVCSKLRQKIRILRQKVRRRTKRITSFKMLLRELHRKEMIDKNAYNLMSDAFSPLTLELFKNEEKNRYRDSHGRRYSDLIVKFAVTLHYYSPKGYEFVRSLLCLPHSASIRQWTASINCQPGHLTEVYKHISKMVDGNDRLRYCSLIVDEMAIKKDSEYCSSRGCFVGGIDFGNGPINEPLANSALVVQLVSLGGQWKAPVAYFLTTHASGEQLSIIIKDSISYAFEAGLSVLCVVSDGTSTNFSAAKKLGVDINTAYQTNADASFVCPSNSGHRVHWIFDACHMLKLMRNLLHDLGVIIYQSNGVKQCIRWCYIESLIRLQDSDSLKLANKLSLRHLYYKRFIMKVKLAAQIFSRSVADAIDFLRDDLQLHAFQGSEPTTDFIRKIDAMFDLLNSRHPFAGGSKAPLRIFNEETWKREIEAYKAFLYSLCDLQGKPLRLIGRKVPICGFIVTLSSVSTISSQLLSVHNFKFVLTYKMSQDHIEILFSKIRLRGGWNNNPTVLQFESALRSILMKTYVTGNPTANVTDFDGINSLEISLPFQRSKPSFNSIFSSSEFDESIAMQHREACERLKQQQRLSDNDWRSNTLFYIAGFVSRTIAKKIACVKCRDALFGDDSRSVNESRSHFLLLRKKRGKLQLPSSGVYKIVKETEHVIRTLFPGIDSGATLPTGKNVNLRIETLVLQNLSLCSLFPQLYENHFADHDYFTEENHIISIFKSVCGYFLKVRFYNYSKVYKDKNVFRCDVKSRQESTKLMLFRGQ